MARVVGRAQAHPGCTHAAGVLEQCHPDAQGKSNVHKRARQAGREHLVCSCLVDLDSTGWLFQTPLRRVLRQFTRKLIADGERGVETPGLNQLYRDARWRMVSRTVHFPMTWPSTLSCTRIMLHPPPPAAAEEIGPAQLRTAARRRPSAQPHCLALHRLPLCPPARAAAAAAPQARTAAAAAPQARDAAAAPPAAAAAAAPALRRAPMLGLGRVGRPPPRARRAVRAGARTRPRPGSVCVSGGIRVLSGRHRISRGRCGHKLFYSFRVPGLSVARVLEFSVTGCWGGVECLASGFDSSATPRGRLISG